MLEAECIARKWGNSLGLIIPKEIVEKEHFSENDKVLVVFKKKRLAKEFFGMLHKWDRPTEEIKKEMKEGWK